MRHSRLRHSARNDRTVGLRHAHLYGLAHLESAHGRTLARQTPGRRALRLGMAAGSALAGLGLVVGLLTLVVAMGDGPPGPDRSQTVANSGRTGPPPYARRGPAGARPLPGATLASYGGTGSAKPVPIRVLGPAPWGLPWSYSCPAGRSGFFTVRVGAGASGRLITDTSGSRGRGVAWIVRAPGDHKIVVTASCPWTARVVRPSAQGPSLGSQQDP